MTPARIFNPESLRHERDRLLNIVASSFATQPFIRSDGRTVSNYVQGHLVLGDPTGLRLATSLILAGFAKRPLRS